LGAQGLIFFSLISMEGIESMNALKKLAIQHRTTKLSSPVSHYLDAYEEQFQGRRAEVQRLLEIGVQGGGSLRMWADFFPQAEIYGLDCDSRCKAQASSRIQIAIGKQEDTSFLEQEIIPQGPYDVIIDDGGHHVEQQKTSLVHLWRAVTPGGVYILEDLHTSYLSRFGGGYEHPQTTVEFLKKHIDGINRKPLRKLLSKSRHSQTITIPPNIQLPNIRSLQFYGCLCFIHKQRS